jgi:hypothetical protein
MFQMVMHVVSVAGLKAQNQRDEAICERWQMQMAKFDLDGIYSRVMRDGKRQDICWTDLVWEERIAEMRKHDEPWLVRMIHILNNVASDIKREYPNARLEQVKFPEGKKVTKRWLRNSLIFLTAELRLVSDEMGVKKAV